MGVPPAMTTAMLMTLVTTDKRKGGQRQVAGYRVPEVILLRRSRQQPDYWQADENNVERASSPAQRSAGASRPTQREPA